MGLFDFLIWAAILSVVVGMICAYDGSRDVFHPLMYLGPMLLFIYGWMPLKLNAANGLEGFFQNDRRLRALIAELKALVSTSPKPTPAGTVSQPKQTWAQPA